MTDVRTRLAEALSEGIADETLTFVHEAGLVVVDPAEITALRLQLQNTFVLLEAASQDLDARERELRDMERELQGAEREVAGWQAEARGY